MELVSASFCVSGAALGAAVASLFRTRDIDAMRSERRRADTKGSSTPEMMGSVHEPSKTGMQLPMCMPKPLGKAVDCTKDRPLAAGWEGFSMEDARRHAAEGAKKAKEVSPSQVLSDLQRGNFRFWTRAANRPDGSAIERRALMTQQFPSTAVLGCSDSRVPTEIVFDQGLGDIFVVRVAGNFLETATSGSLQYAVNHLKVKVLIVMGHEGCGAIKAACLPVEKIKQEPTDLSNALLELKDGLDEERLQHVYDSRARDREAVVSNVRRQVEKLTRIKCIMRAVRAKELIIVGAFYEISSGIVDFFHEVSDESLVSGPVPQGVPIRRSSGSSTPSNTMGVMSRFNVCVEKDNQDDQACEAVKGNFAWFKQ